MTLLLLILAIATLAWPFIWIMVKVAREEIASEQRAQAMRRHDDDSEDITLERLQRAATNPQADMVQKRFDRIAMEQVKASRGYRFKR